MAAKFDPSNIDVKTGEPKVKPKVVIGVNTPADKYVPPKADKQVVITAKPAQKPKAAAAATRTEKTREAITAMKRREADAGT
jgi:hypothetical protein